MYGFEAARYQQPVTKKSRYRGTPLIINTSLLGPYRRTKLGSSGGPQGGGLFVALGFLAMWSSFSVAALMLFSAVNVPASPPHQALCAKTLRPNLCTAASVDPYPKRRGSTPRPPHPLTLRGGVNRLSVAALMLFSAVNVPARFRGTSCV